MASEAETQAPGRSSKDIAAFVIAGIVLLFMVVNLDKVSVNWVVGSFQTPLIVVIVVSALLGAGADRLVQRRERKRAKADLWLRPS